MLARVRFLATADTSSPEGELRQRVFAPEQTLQLADDGGVTVLIVNDRNRAELRTVTPGRTSIDGWREVKSGLNPGDLIITNAPADLAPGDRVRHDAADS